MITDYLDAIIGEGTYHNTSKGTQYSYQCPLCGDYKDRLFVNIDRGKFFCHHCGMGGTTVTLVSLINNITWKEALTVYREYQNDEVELPEDIEHEVYTRLIEGAMEIEIPKFVYPLPEEFILLEEARGKAGKEALAYVKSRGISMDTCIKQYIGYCEEGKYADRIIMPDFEDGELKYWQARTWKPEPKLKILKQYYRKVLNPSLTDEQKEQGIIAIDKSDVVSNIDLIKKNRTAIICEGKFDSYTIGDSGACIHGKYLSDEQFIKLVRNKKDIDTIIVMLDGDAFKYAVSAAKRLHSHFNDVWVAKMPDERDPNKLGKKGVLDVINNHCLPYTTMFEARAKIKGWLD